MRCDMKIPYSAGLAVLTWRATHKLAFMLADYILLFLDTVLVPPTIIPFNIVVVPQIFVLFH